MTAFKDRFSGHAAEYARYRPRYPRELFAYLASVAPDRSLAWDCATGNGQAAVGLAEFFDRVIATDASDKQVANAQPHDRVEYRVAPAERSGLEADTVDLVTVAQALHWFDREGFFAEASRVLRPGGTIAVWTYDLFKISPRIDALVEKFYRETVGPYWDFERTLVESGYREIAFPFREIERPNLQMAAEWSLEETIGYLRTWSATKNFIVKRGFDPVDPLALELGKVWGEPNGVRSVRWPLSFRIGRAARA